MRSQGADVTCAGMTREHRANENWTLLRAIELAKQQDTSVIVVFSLVNGFLGAGYRQFAFMLRGLQEVAGLLNDAGLPFVMLRGDPGATIAKFSERVDACAIVTDFTPMRVGRAWQQTIAEHVPCPLIEVDSRNVVPCWIASDKLEFAARTIRPKIHALLPEFLEPYPSVEHSFEAPLSEDELTAIAAVCSDLHSTEDNAAPSVSLEGLCGHGTHLDWTKMLEALRVDRSVAEVTWLKPGPAAAQARFTEFLLGVRKYQERNDPSKDATSLMSPYLHFGHISSQALAMGARISRSVAPEAVDSFIEELVVRRELSDNYVLHNPDGYDRLGGLYPQYGNRSWAQKTLIEHAGDKREVIYTREQFERGETHDPLWNAMQAEMVHRGHMPGFNRMYWAKSE
jgi:deoxyribodipyrimidine photo-lyase